MNHNKECIFCKIINNELPSKKVYEDEYILAFHDINPNAPVHVLVIPKVHIPCTNYIDKDNIDFISKIFVEIPNIVRDLNIYESGYRIVSNSGADSGQMVDHLHFHILGGNKLSIGLG